MCIFDCVFHVVLKIEARRGGLDMLGSADASFRYLVESFPRLLLLSVESHVKPVVDFLEIVGVPKDRVGNMLLLFPPIIFWNIKAIRTKALAFEEVPFIKFHRTFILFIYLSL